jgi:hypothetical protein
MLRDGHVRFGGRAEETDRLRGRHRASVRPLLHLPAHRRGVAVPRRGPGQLLAADRRLVDGHPHALKSGGRRAEDGARAPASRARACSPLRLRRAAQAQPVLATVPVDVTLPLASDGLRMVLMVVTRLVGGDAGVVAEARPEGLGRSGDSRMRAGQAGVPPAPCSRSPVAAGRLRSRRPRLALGRFAESRDVGQLTRLLSGTRSTPRRAFSSRGSCGAGRSAWQRPPRGLPRCAW